MSDSIATSVARNTTVMLAQQLSTWLSTFILMLFLPRYLGPVEYGRLYLALTITAIFGTFVNYGGFQTVAKQVARSPESVHLICGNAFGFRVVISVASLIGMVVFSMFAGYPVEQRVLNLICSLALLWQAGNVALYGCYQGRELLAYTSIGAVAEKILVSALGVTALLLGAGSVTLALIITLSTLVNFAVLLKFSPRIMSALPKINWKASFRLIKQDVHFFLFAVFGAIYYRIDTIMLSLLAPERVVGWYGASYRFFDVLNFLPSIFTIAVFPVLSRLWKSEEETHARTMQKSLEFMILSGVPLAVIVIGFARPIIQILYGLEAYGPSVILLQVLCLGLPFLYIDMVLGMTLLASDKQKQLSIVALCANPVNIALNYFMIPWAQSNFGNGAIGSALATVLTELLVMVSAFSLLPKGILRGFRTAVPAKTIIAGGVAGSAIALMSALGMQWYISVVLSPLIYLGVLLIENTFEPGEIEFARGLLTRESLRRTFIPSRGVGS